MKCRIVPRYYKISFYLQETDEIKNSDYVSIYKLVNHINQKTDVICVEDGTPANFNDMVVIIDNGSKYVRNFIDTAVSKGLIYIEDDKYILNPYLHIMSFGTDKSVYKLFDNLPEWNHLIERMEKYYDEYNLELTFYKRESKYDRNQIVYEYVEYY